MKKAAIGDHEVTLFDLNTLVVGSGAAGLNAAARLHALGVNSLALMTEGMNMGTSRNTGSDKQTYYKLTLAGGELDSVGAMAQTLYGGGAMHGDVAMVEAALSARCFYRLAELGVPFPQNRYGEYVGYKTDHDPRQRATSAGPLTSRLMTEALEREIRQRHITIFDGYQAIAILPSRNGQEVRGVLALNLSRLDHPDQRYALFNCRNIVYATGGPAGMYKSSVYPLSQSGATGIALEAGARACNLTESQFGLASTRFRWNVSGTYQQVLPRFTSTDQSGGDQREFLLDYFSTPGKMLNAVFLKGYQWPFDPRKAAHEGSSLVDLCVYHQVVDLNRRVFMDFRANPLDETELNFSLLGPEARHYLEKSGALFGTPIQRLAHMNQPAIDLYKSNGIDLWREPLEVAVCNQHANGGLAADHWWQSNLQGLFPVGEVNGSHGVYRPGGSALNSGQVGSTRAAIYIARRRFGEPLPQAEFLEECADRAARFIHIGQELVKAAGPGNTVLAMRDSIGRRMDQAGGIIRSKQKVVQAMAEARLALVDFNTECRLSDCWDLPYAFQNRDLLICQIAWLKAIADYIDRGGGCRGSFVIHDPTGLKPCKHLPAGYEMLQKATPLEGQVQTLVMSNDTMRIEWEPVRPIPQDDAWFENVWRSFLSDGNVG